MVDHPLHCNLPHFAKLIRTTRHTTQENDKARYNFYQFSSCFTYFTIRLWNNVPNEVVLAVKQDHFIDLAKKCACDQ